MIAIETSRSAGSVAWVEPGGASRQILLDPNRRTAATLAVALEELLAESRTAGRTVDSVAVAHGPGSFTGLRIGVTAAKLLAYALGCPLVAVDTLAAAAAVVWQRHPECEAVLVGMNAYRKQVFAADWPRADWEFSMERGRLDERSQVWQMEQWLGEIAEQQPGRLFVADAGLLPNGRDDVLPFELTALDVAEVAAQSARRGRFVSPMELTPNYLRSSAAEEKLQIAPPTPEQFYPPSLREGRTQ